MAGRSSSSSLPSSSRSQASSGLARTYAKGDPQKFLGPCEMKEIFNELKDVVWVLDVGFMDSNVEQQLGMQGTGFCVHPEGYILTAAHLFPEDFTDIQIRKIDDVYFRSSNNGHVRLVKKFDSLDIALIKAEISREGDEHGFDYALFGDGKIFRGQQVISIGHPMKWVYTSVHGEACFPCLNEVTLDSNPRMIKNVDIETEVLNTAWHHTPAYRKARDVIDMENEELNFFRTDVPLVQINNFHGTNGSSGSPVFNATGRIIGMIVFCEANMDFAVHVSVLEHLLTIHVEEDRVKKRQEKEGKGKQIHRGKRRKGKHPKIHR